MQLADHLRPAFTAELRWNVKGLTKSNFSFSITVPSFWAFDCLFRPNVAEWCSMRVTLLQSIFLSRRRMINALCRVSVTFFSPLLIYRTEDGHAAPPYRNESNCEGATRNICLWGIRGAKLNKEIGNFRQVSCWAFFPVCFIVMPRGVCVCMQRNRSARSFIRNRIGNFVFALSCKAAKICAEKTTNKKKCKFLSLKKERNS